jgi:hypothetical protein
VPVIKEDITCLVAISKVGSLNFQFAIQVNFGNGFVQTIMLSHANTSSNALFQTQYQAAGNYTVKFKVPLTNTEWNLNQVLIKGKSNKRQLINESKLYFNNRFPRSVFNQYH